MQHLVSIVPFDLSILPWQTLSESSAEAARGEPWKERSAGHCNRGTASWLCLDFLHGLLCCSWRLCFRLKRKKKTTWCLKVFEVTPSLYMVELRKSNGDTLEFHKVYVVIELVVSLFILWCLTLCWSHATLRMNEQTYWFCHGIGCVSPQFYHNISNGLKDVMWKPESGIVEGDEARQRRSPWWGLQPSFRSSAADN